MSRKHKLFRIGCRFGLNFLLDIVNASITDRSEFGKELGIQLWRLRFGILRQNRPNHHEERRILLLDERPQQLINAFRRENVSLMQRQVVDEINELLEVIVPLV